MMSKTQVCFAALLTIFMCFGSWGSAQQSRKPLSEQDVIKLLKMGASSAAVTDIVEQYGVSFAATKETLGRLKESGAQDSLLEIIRRKAPGPPPAPKEIAPSSVTPPNPEADRHLAQGELKALGGDLEGALREYEAAEKIRPGWGEVWFQRSLVLADLGRYPGAVAELKKYMEAPAPGVDVAPLSRKISEWQARAGDSKKISDLIDAGKKELKAHSAGSAIKSFQDALKLDYSVTNMLDLAGAYLLQGDYESLSKTADQVLALDPLSAQGLVYKSAAELERGDQDQSMATLQKALFLNPNLASGYAFLSAALTRKEGSGNPPPKGASIEQAGSNGASEHIRAGWAFWNEGEYEAALNELRQATEIEPQFAAGHIDLSYALNFRGDAEGASAAARHALGLNPNSAGAHDALGMALENEGKFEQAAQEYKEAVRLSPPGYPAFVEHLARVAHKKAPAQSAVGASSWSGRSAWTMAELTGFAGPFAPAPE